MTTMTVLSRMTNDEFLVATAAECARVQRELEALLRRLQLQLALTNYVRRRCRLPVLYGWATLADTAVSSRLRCDGMPRRRRPF